MNTDRKPKPTIDAVNDAIGALSDLLHALRTHAKAAAKDVKSTAATVKGDARLAGRRAVKTGKRTVRKVEATGAGLLDKAAKVWHDITGRTSGQRRTSVVTRKRRVVRCAVGILAERRPRAAARMSGGSLVVLPRRPDSAGDRAPGRARRVCYAPSAAPLGARRWSEP
jgi:hypothetical protein